MTRPRVLLIGATGQVGRELLARLDAAGLGPVATPSRTALDLADAASIMACLDTFAPTLVINAAAYTAVDRAESEPAEAHAVNALGPAVLAAECHRLIHYSTDYVFGDRPGFAVTPDCDPPGWRETDLPTPLSVYGATKLDGDRAILDAVARGADAWIFRVGWVYAAPLASPDAPATPPRGFFATLQRRALSGLPLEVVADRHGSPTWAGAIAEATVRALVGSPERRPPPGLYHLASRDGTTWHGFAQAIVESLTRATNGLAATPQPDLRATLSPDPPPPGAARRPRVSRLDPSHFEDTFGFGLAPWREQFAACVGHRPP